MEILFIVNCDMVFPEESVKQLIKLSVDLHWQKCEIWIKINDEGISVESSLTNSRFIINSEEAKVVNKNTGETQTTFNGDKTILKRGLVEEEFTIGKLRFTVLENGDVMGTFDD